MPEPDRQLYIDKRLDAYTNYLPSDTAKSLSGIAESAPLLDRFVLDLLLEWRTTAYTASMPAVFVQSLRSLGESYMGTVSPDSSVVTFADVVLAKLSRKLPELVENRQLRSQIASELVTLAAEMRDVRSKVSPDIDVEPIWNDYLKLEAFAMSVWSSQRVAYVAFYNAYETFLVRCVKQTLGIDSLRTTSKEFKPALREQFQTDIIDSCWIDPSLNVARLVRHALSHAGGSETPDLKKQRHHIVLLDSVLQIAPQDNHALLRVLFVAVESLIKNAVQLPQFA